MVNELQLVTSFIISPTSEIIAVAVNTIPDWMCGVRYASEAVVWTSAYAPPGRGEYAPQALTGRPTVFTAVSHPDSRMTTPRCFVCLFFSLCVYHSIFVVDLPVRFALSTVTVSFGELFCTNAVQFYFNRGGPAIVKLEAATSGACVLPKRELTDKRQKLDRFKLFETISRPTLLVRHRTLYKKLICRLRNRFFCCASPSTTASTRFVLLKSTRLLCWKCPKPVAASLARPTTTR